MAVNGQVLPRSPWKTLRLGENHSRLAEQKGRRTTSRLRCSIRNGPGRRLASLHLWGVPQFFLIRRTHETAVRTFLMIQEPEPPIDGPNPTLPVGRPLVEFSEQVVCEFWSSVYRFLYCVTGNAHDAEDLTQETFLRAWNRLDSFHSGSCIKPWLLRIAANAAHDVRRRRGRVGFSSLEHDPPSATSSPESRVELAEQEMLLAKAVEHLSEMTRMVFHLRVQESLSFREIAEMVGTTEQGARWHMHQARTKLLKLFRENP